VALCAATLSIASSLTRVRKLPSPEALVRELAMESGAAKVPAPPIDHGISHRSPTQSFGC
jgi:hypothetical protein